MFDIWFGEIEITTLAIIVSVVVLFPVQLLLCFKVKSLTIRLVPVITLSILTSLFVVLSIFSPNWDGLGYASLSILSGIMLLVCGIGWGIWSVVHRVRKK